MTKRGRMAILIALAATTVAAEEPHDKSRAAERPPGRATMLLDEGDVCGSYSVTFDGNKRLGLRWRPPAGAHLGAAVEAACRSLEGDYRK